MSRFILLFYFIFQVPRRHDADCYVRNANEWKGSARTASESFAAQQAELGRNASLAAQMEICRNEGKKKKVLNDSKVLCCTRKKQVKLKKKSTD